MGRGPVVGYVGRIVPSKGIPGLIKAMRTVWQWNPDVRLVLAGPRTLVGMRAEAVSSCWEFDKRDKASIYDGLDLFAMPSTGESFGIAHLEAWMCRKPVIGANVGSTPSVIRDGVDGLLVDP